MQSISLNWISGNALVFYDAALTNEQRLMKHLISTWDQFVELLVDIDPGSPITDAVIMQHKTMLKTIIERIKKEDKSWKEPT